MAHTEICDILGRRAGQARVRDNTIKRRCSSEPDNFGIAALNGHPAVAYRIGVAFARLMEVINANMCSTCFGEQVMYTASILLNHSCASRY